MSSSRSSGGGSNGQPVRSGERRNAGTRPDGAAARGKTGPRGQSLKRAGEVASVSPEKPGQYNLRLYVAGQTPKSIAAFANLKRLCEEHLPGRYKIEVIDLLENPQLAAGDQILALPTLVRKLPPPLKRIIGSITDADKFLVGMDLRNENRPVPELSNVE